MNLSCAAGSIKVVSSAKYLGVFIDDKQNFQEHIKHLEEKVSRSVGIISKLKNYLPKHALFKLYYTLVHSHLLNGLIVWETHIQPISPNYSQTSVIERFGSRPNRFSNNKFEIFTFQTSNKNSDLDQTERSRANTNAP